MADYALGIDIGGTFTDIVVYDATRGAFSAHKELTSPDAPHRGAVAGIHHLFKAQGIHYRDISRVVKRRCKRPRCTSKLRRRREQPIRNSSRCGITNER